MLKMLEGVKLREWFGEFGGNFCINDTALLRNGKPELEYERVLPGREFERIFREVLAETLPGPAEAKRFSWECEKSVTVLPASG